MVAAVLRAYYSVKDISTLSTALGWVSREAFVSALTVCAPGIKPLVSSSRWFSSSSKGTSGVLSNTATGKGSRFFTGSKSQGGENGDAHPYELSSSMAWRRSRREPDGESQEHIVVQAKTSEELSHSPPIGNEIMVTTDVTLTEETTQNHNARV